MTAPDAAPTAADVRLALRTSALGQRVAGTAAVVGLQDAAVANGQVRGEVDDGLGQPVATGHRPDTGPPGRAAEGGRERRQPAGLGGPPPGPVCVPQPDWRRLRPTDRGRGRHWGRHLGRHRWARRRSTRWSRRRTASRLPSSSRRPASRRPASRLRGRIDRRPRPGQIAGVGDLQLGSNRFPEKGRHLRQPAFGDGAVPDGGGEGRLRGRPQPGQAGGVGRGLSRSQVELAPHHAEHIDRHPGVPLNPALGRRHHVAFEELADGGEQLGRAGHVVRLGHGVTRTADRGGPIRFRTPAGRWRPAPPSGPRPRCGPRPGRCT